MRKGPHGKVEDRTIGATHREPFSFSYCFLIGGDYLPTLDHGIAIGCEPGRNALLIVAVQFIDLPGHERPPSEKVRIPTVVMGVALPWLPLRSATARYSTLGDTWPGMPAAPSILRSIRHVNILVNFK